MHSLLHLRRAFFFFTEPATTEIYTLSLHDALPISYWSASWWRRRRRRPSCSSRASSGCARRPTDCSCTGVWRPRSEEHTSELQSHSDLVCRLLLEKKKKRTEH